MKGGLRVRWSDGRMLWWYQRVRWSDERRVEGELET